MWSGDYPFVLSNLILKDFRVRYRNMSLGMLWSLLNPLVMMGVLTFVFTVIFPSKIENFAVFVLCGLVPFNFFSLSWSAATVSIVDNVNLVKRSSVPREIIPVASVLANCVHMSAQVALLLIFAAFFGGKVTWAWLWLPLLWAFFITFICGLGILFAAIDVYIRDARYVVESANTMLFWLVPIFYSFTQVSPEYSAVYELNPVAGMIVALRDVILDGNPPRITTITKLGFGSVAMLVFGLAVFNRLKRRFYDYL